MPQFLEPNADELNAYRSINKKIIKDLKRQYRGTESTQGIQGDIQDKYTFVYEKMVDIIGALSEISNQLKLGHTAPSASGSKAIDRFIGGTSAVMKATKILLNYMNQEVPSIHIFPVEQQQTITGLNDQMVGAVLEIDQLSTDFLAPSTLARFRQVVAGFKQDLVLLQQRLEGQQGDMGTGSVGTTFAAPARRKQGRRKTQSFPVDSGEEADIEGSGYMGTGGTMNDGYGKGYRTQIAAGMMPSRFL